MLYIVWIQYKVLYRYDGKSYMLYKVWIQYKVLVIQCDSNARIDNGSMKQKTVTWI